MAKVANKRLLLKCILAFPFFFGVCYSNVLLIILILYYQNKLFALTLLALILIKFVYYCQAAGILPYWAYLAFAMIFNSHNQ